MMTLIPTFSLDLFEDISRPFSEMIWNSSYDSPRWQAHSKCPGWEEGSLESALSPDRERVCE